MFTTLKDFKAEWQNESAATLRLFGALTDESLHAETAPGYRTLGRLGSHLVTSMHEMPVRTGLKFEPSFPYDHIPDSASELADAYRKASEAFLEAVEAQWTDASLLQESDMYGDRWPNGLTLRLVIKHEIHHRAQMTVLMRLAGLRVPGLYGPAKEDWSDWGQEAPAI